MKQIKWKILLNLTYQNLMSVYWSMYYLEKLEQKKVSEKKSKAISKVKQPKIKINIRTVSEKKK